MTATVLVVDDDADVRSLITLQLTMAGLSVTESGTVDGALAALAVGPSPDLVLTDLNFGGDSAQRLVEHCLAAGQAVVLMTASVTFRSLPAEVRERVPILRKPFSLTELTSTVTAAIETGGAP